MRRMKAETASRHIESFYKHFGEAHLYFACHAALPVALTPDLLYLIWNNFQRDINGRELNIPWIAVADLLLSGLCHEVGHELYEMDLPVRKTLLNILQKNQNFERRRIQDISNFLLEYIKPQLSSADQDIQDLAQTQRLTALAYLNPKQVAREIAKKFEKINQQDTTELLQITSLVETLAEPLSEYKDLLSYNRAISNFLRGKIEEATIQFLELIEGKSKITAFGATLPIPERIKANFSIVETSHNKFLPIIGGGLSAFIITMLGSFGLQPFQRNFLPDAIPTNPPIPEINISDSPIATNVTPSTAPVPTPIASYSPSQGGFPFLIPNPIISQNPQPNPTISPSQENPAVITLTPQSNKMIPTAKPTAEPKIINPPLPTLPSTSNTIPPLAAPSQPNITNSPVPARPIPTSTATFSPPLDGQNSLISKAEIYNVTGEVTITRNNQTLQSVKKGDLLLPGDILRTGSRSRAEILFNGDSVFNEASFARIGSNSTFRYPINGMRELKILPNVTLESIQKKQEEIAAELAVARGKMDFIEKAIAQLETDQNSNSPMQNIKTVSLLINSLGQELLTLRTKIQQTIKDIGNFEDNSVLSKDEEFAALARLNRELGALLRLNQEFAAEIATLQGRYDSANTRFQRLNK